MCRVGILTFHRVYNYGAAIQAFSLQQVLKEYGYDSEIIDYSKAKQYDYTNVISTKNGIKRFIKTLLLLPVFFERVKRKKKFDQFFSKQMCLSKKQYRDEKSLIETNELYETFLIGSDQVWNIKKESDFSTAYLLDFVADNKRKIAYAPSIGTSGLQELKMHINLLRRFKAISCRESGGTTILREVTGMDVRTVLDPTLLVSQKALKQVSRKINRKPYLFYYSLDGYDKRERNMALIKYLSERFALDIVIITPEWPFHKRVGQDIRDAGPEDFLSLIRNASLVCTNSFHGTALAIKFERPLYVLEDRNIQDERKRSVLEQVGALDRIVSSIEELEKIESYEMDYSVIHEKMELLERISKKYLLEAINDKYE